MKVECTEGCGRMTVTLTTNYQHTGSICSECRRTKYKRDGLARRKAKWS